MYNQLYGTHLHVDINVQANYGLYIHWVLHLCNAACVTFDVYD